MIEKFSDFKLWCLFFFYTFFISVSIQFVLLPYILPSLYAGNGLLNSSFDSIGFHKIALDLANKMRIQGWSAWEFRPGGQTPAGIAAIFYYYIIPDPRVLIPISSLLHASAALILFKLINLLVRDKLYSVICVIPFLIFPSNLQWTAQWHRDGFSILGLLLVLEGMILSARLLNYKAENWFFSNFSSIIFYTGGFILVWFARPYLFTIIEPFVCLFFSVLFLFFLIKTFQKKIAQRRVVYILLSMLLIVFALERVKTNVGLVEFKENALVPDNNDVVVEHKEEDAAAESITEELSLKSEALVIAARNEAPVIAARNEAPVIAAREEAPVIAAREEAQVIVAKDEDVKIISRCRQKTRDSKTKIEEVKDGKLNAKYYIEDHWSRSFGLPLFVENKAYSLAIFRKGFRLSSPEAKSNIDRDIGFGSVKDILIYLPRAAKIVFLAPFPSQWFDDGSYAANSLMRRISALEMIVVYFTLLFLPYAIWYWRKRIEIWIIYLFCIYMMLVHGLVVCNIGSLYRMRYPYATILAALGIAGFITLLIQLNIKKNK